jgi:hypothetical protein
MRILAAARGIGWRFTGTRLGSGRSGALEASRRVRAAWLLVTDGRPALGPIRETD